MNTHLEIVLTICLLFVLIVLLNPTHLLMPETAQMIAVLFLVIGFLVFMGLIWRERAVDERESLHMYKSGRISFFVGSTILVLGIAVQALHHAIDSWLLYSLAGMVLTKFVVRLFHQFKN